jgi:hypothetical protein
MVSPIWPVAAVIDEARLVGMECESIPSKALAQDAEDPFGIEEVLERHHSIISEADKGTSPLETWPQLPLKPFIQHVVLSAFMIRDRLLSWPLRIFRSATERPGSVLFSLRLISSPFPTPPAQLSEVGAGLTVSRGFLKRKIRDRMAPMERFIF